MTRAPKQQTTIQLSAEDLERVDALIDPMRLAAREVGGSITRSAVIRAAVLRGIEELERRYLGESKEPPKPWENK